MNKNTFDIKRLLFQSEKLKKFSNSSWIPLRVYWEAQSESTIRELGFFEDSFYLGAVAIRAEFQELGDKLNWSEIGVRHEASPVCDSDGYSPIDEYLASDGTPIGVELIFPQPQYPRRRWLINPDLVVALGLIQEDRTEALKVWVRPEEGFEEVIREHFDSKGSHTKIAIRRHFLLDYLAARNLHLRLASYRRRILNIETLEGSPYEGLADCSETILESRFEFRISSLHEQFGGDWQVKNLRRLEVDTEVDVPEVSMTDGVLALESFAIPVTCDSGFQMFSELWVRDWVLHQGKSTRIRRDPEEPTSFIFQTDGSREPLVRQQFESDLRWLWFKAAVILELLKIRGFSLQWWTSETGVVRSASGSRVHFGLNSEDLVNVLSCDIAELPRWEQQIWSASNVVPVGGVSPELIRLQVNSEQVDSDAPEKRFFAVLSQFRDAFRAKFGNDPFTSELDKSREVQVLRFRGTDLQSLLAIAKNLHMCFGERLDVALLKRLSGAKKDEKLGSIKLLQKLIESEISDEARARSLCSVIAGVYDMRIGDAHLTSSKIGESLTLAQIDTSRSFLRQAEQLIFNYQSSIDLIASAIFPGWKLVL